MPTSDKYTCRTDVQKAAKAAFEALIADQARADAAYDALSATDGGKIISTDLVRELDARYAATPRGKKRDLAPSWEMAWVYAHDRFHRELSKGGRGKLVRFMAGGWAAGKTRIVENLRCNGSAAANLTWDGTLKDRDWAEAQIRFALQKEWSVDVVYVHRNIELALYGAIERGMAEGRYVPLDKLPGNHRAVQTTIRELIDALGADVSFQLFHNTGSANLAGVALTFSKDALAPDGALHYSSNYENYYQSAAGEIHRSATR